MILDDKLSNQEIIVLDGAIGSKIRRLGGCCGTTVERIRAMVGALPAAVGPRRA